MPRLVQERRTFQGYPGQVPEAVISAARINATPFRRSSQDLNIEVASPAAPQFKRPHRS
jgi:hypothetical protein